MGLDALLREPTARIQNSLPYFVISRDCSHRNIARTSLSGCGFTRVTSHLSIKPWGRFHAFLPMGINSPAFPDAMAETGIPPPKFPASKDCSQAKSAIINNSGWPWMSEALTCLPNTEALCFPSYGKELSCFSRHPWPELGFYLQHFLL